jgi:hypothetical protein
MGTGLPTIAGTRGTLLPGFETFQANMTAALATAVFQDASTIWLVDAGALTVRHVLHIVLDAATSRWRLVRTIRFNTAATVYSITGRVEADGVYYLYALATAGGTGVRDGAIFKYNTVTGSGLVVPFATNQVANTRWRAIMLPPVDAAMSAPTLSGTRTPSATGTPSPSQTPSSSVTPTSSGTGTPSSSVTGTPSSSATASLSVGVQPSESSSLTASATATGSLTATPTSSVSPRYQSFVSTNILVVRSGDGTAAFSGASSTTAPVFLDEINLSLEAPALFGTTSQRVPIVGSVGVSRRCGLDNLYWRDGWAQRSADGRFVTLLCLDVTPGLAWPGDAVGVFKTVARIAANGVVDTTTGASNLITAGNYYVYSSHSADGSGYYVMGPSATSCDNNAGIRYIPHGGSVSVQLNATLGRCNYDSRFTTVRSSRPAS